MSCTCEARRAPALLALLVAALLAGCAEVESEPVTGYEPSELEAVPGRDDLKRVTFTAEGARRTGLRSAPVRRSGAHRVVPYAALLYDAHGKTFVYTRRRPLVFTRKEVEVARIAGERALLSAGPAAGTEVVTVGAAEVYGTELEVPSH